MRIVKENQTEFDEGGFGDSGALKDGTVEQPFSGSIVKSWALNDIINVLEEGRVDIEVSGPHINIKSEKGVSFDISTVPFQEYPEIPENKHDNLFCIETSCLKDIISSSVIVTPLTLILSLKLIRWGDV